MTENRHQHICWCLFSSREVFVCNKKGESVSFRGNEGTDTKTERHRQRLLVRFFAVSEKPYHILQNEGRKEYTSVYALLLVSFHRWWKVSGFYYFLHVYKTIWFFVCECGKHDGSSSIPVCLYRNLFGSDLCDILLSV